jgi:hypothetical protein
MNAPMKKGQGLNWNPASVELPEIPTIEPGPDALSSTIAAVLPTLGVPLAANVVTLQAKEGTFAGKLGAAEAAYQSSDDQGSQAVGQIVGMLGQVGQQAGQLSQMAGAPAQAAGGGSGIFGSLIEQAMKAAQSAGGETQTPEQQGADVGAAPVAGAGGQPPGRDAGAQQDPQEPREAGSREQYREPQPEELEPLQRADDSSRASGPEQPRSGVGAVPVTPPEAPRDAADDDLGRRL